MNQKIESIINRDALNRNNKMMNTENIRVAITGMNAKPDNPGPGVAVARCLCEEETFKGEIIGLSYDVLDPGLYLDEFVNHAYLLPYPSNGEQVLLERLQYIYSQVPFDILIPCLDAELVNIITIKDELAEMGIKVLMPDAETLQLRDKDRLPDLSKQAGIKTPEVISITQAGFFYDCHKKGWQYPLVVKGVYYDAGVARNPDEAAAIFRKIAAEWGYPVLVQRYIEGEEFNLTALGDGKGNLTGSVMMRKRAVTEKGKAWAGISINDDKLRNAAEKLVKTLKWSGPLEIEMLRSKQGEYYLIEINPRFPAWIYLSAAVGCNLPWALVQLLQGEEVKLPKPEIGKLFIRYAQETVINIQEFENMTMWGNS